MPSYLVSRCLSVDDYGLLKQGDPRLVEVPGVEGPRLLHACAATVVYATLQLWVEAGKPGATRKEPMLLLASGWREPLWNSYAEYKAAMIKQYGSLERGKLFRAFRSSHGTGLVWDWGTCGLSPVSKTAAKQRVREVYQFLSGLAASGVFAACPVECYSMEPWHWQARVTREEWLTPPAWARQGGGS